MDNPSDRSWSVADARETYQIREWSNGYFDVNSRGHVEVTPRGPGGPSINLHDLVIDLQRRGYQLPVLVRFSEILDNRLAQLNAAFRRAIDEYGYRAGYRLVYPIKVNQQCDILEELLEHGRPWQMGLEAGSKPELLVALAYMDQTDGVIVCNGFKDRAYIETALLAQQLGRRTILVIDRFDELELIVRTSEELGLRPRIGLRVRLASKGAGRWNESGGSKSKFGLNTSQIVALVDRLREANMLECLELMHFHIGSQITEIRAIKDALRESARFYAELHGLGARVRFLDVGGGLGVDYDGSRSGSSSSVNYGLQEYANDVVGQIQLVCDEAKVPHPEIISESGRALTAYHSVLIFDVLGASEIESEVASRAADQEVPTLKNLYDTYQGITETTYREMFHDAQQLRDEAWHLFDLGYLDLQGRARAEELYWSICVRVSGFADADTMPELEGLEELLADTYYCNFSLFQSVPDSWAVDQLFPVMPIHRLTEPPMRVGTLADLTCDSDGKICRFIAGGEVKKALELHAMNGRPYYLGMFLVGAYQETLGDLHNLFGDTTAVHVRLDEQHRYRVDHVVEGDTVEEVLSYVQYEKRDLIRRVRRASEHAVRTGALKMEQSARLLRRFEEGLAGYTYLSRDEVALDVEEEAVVERPAESAWSQGS